ncbi:MAG: hemolysin III family protein [Pseudomonadota bacterium]
MTYTAPITDEPNYPSGNPAFRRADFAVHAIGLTLILIAGPALIATTAAQHATPVTIGAILYVAAALASNLASWAYHFAPWHAQRTLLRRIDHAAIYSSISGTFTPFFLLSSAAWPKVLLWLCWGLAGTAALHKITATQVKSRWSTASYLALGALGLTALPYMGDLPIAVLYCILLGAVFYVVGTGFYARRAQPYRYAIWHGFVNLGAMAMFAGVWIATTI